MFYKKNKYSDEELAKILLCKYNAVHNLYEMLNYELESGWLEYQVGEEIFSQEAFRKMKMEKRQHQIQKEVESVMKKVFFRFHISFPQNYKDFPEFQNKLAQRLEENVGNQYHGIVLINHVIHVI